MPRENRKRGKKLKKSQRQVLPEVQAQEREDHRSNNSSEPSWIVSAREAEDAHPEAPFGYVDPDVKAYFRTVDEQIQSWQEDGSQPVDEDGDLDPNEAKRVLFVAALGEMSGKEKQLATDPDCSVILERMTYSMDDFVLRVFVDRLNGSFEALFKHRFASHVCQTLLSVATDTISREVKDIFPDVPASDDNGELRTLIQLVLDICKEVGPSFNSLIMDPFASHVLRSLLLLLCPTVLPEDSARKSVRSKKSMSWKAKHGDMKSVFSNDKSKETRTLSGPVPSSFRDAANQFLRILSDGLDANEVRALAANKVASPLLQLVLEIEADHNSASSPDSLMDRVLVGMIKAHHEDPTASIEPSDYLVTLLRDPTSSHLLETLVSRCPERVFNILWSTYFEGKLVRLVLHPVANFVVAKAVERQDSKQLDNTLEELKSVSSRTGVLRALIDRSRSLVLIARFISSLSMEDLIRIAHNATSSRVLDVLLESPTRRPEEWRTLQSNNKTSPAESGQPSPGPVQPQPNLSAFSTSQKSLKRPAVGRVSVHETKRSTDQQMSAVLSAVREAPSAVLIRSVFEAENYTSFQQSFPPRRLVHLAQIPHFGGLVEGRIPKTKARRLWYHSTGSFSIRIAELVVPCLGHTVGRKQLGRTYEHNLGVVVFYPYLGQEWRRDQISRVSSLRVRQRGPHRSPSLTLPSPSLCRLCVRGTA
ncbi:armadillo-type protein, partial [Butyriboletus roseoflavus]